MLLYLVLALLVVLVVIAVVLLVRGGKDGVDLVDARVMDLARRQEQTRKDLLDMMEKYRSGMSLSLQALDGKLAVTNGETRKELLGMMEQYRASVGQLENKVASGLEQIRADNEKRLLSMQESVDVRLKSSLATSFHEVTDQLNKVYEGLGQVKELTSGVDDLKRLMGNIKTRGTMGEVQAKNILDDILSPGQYDENVECKPHSGFRVEFAVRLPGDGEEIVHLPIDCKFPKEDYERILNAQDAGDKDALAAARKALETRVKEEARDIAGKYLDPPHTTAFALLFLPTEGLYAEVLRIPGLLDTLQRTWKVVPAGPTTLAALLNSLQMGFRTLAIQKRSEEVWQVLSAVKTEFSRFGSELETAQRRVELVSRSFDEVAKRTRAMDRKLKDVEVMDAGKAQQMIDE